MTIREVNRATLARQMLLGREKSSLTRAVSRLLGLQAQLPRPPVIGLWSRLEGVSRADVLGALSGRSLVRATAMRGTIHLMTAADFVKFRACLQASLDAGMHAILRDGARKLDLPALGASAAAFFRKPHTFEEARAHLASVFPGGDQRAMGYAARMSVPLVQVPGDDRWGFPPQACFVSAEAWLGKPVAPCASPDGLLLRYLEAYGPATLRDAQAWLGLGGLEPALARLGRKVVTLPGPDGKPLYDVPGAPRPDGDTPAPVRFLPEWDSVVVTRADARVVARAHRPRVFLPGLRVAATVLVDGVAGATWKVAATARKATLQVDSFTRWPASVRREVEEEGSALLRFVEPGAKAYDVQVTTS